MNLPLWSWEKYEIWYGNSFNKDIDEAKAPNTLLLSIKEPNKHSYLILWRFYNGGGYL